MSDFTLNFAENTIPPRLRAAPAQPHPARKARATLPKVGEGLIWRAAGAFALLATAYARATQMALVTPFQAASPAPRACGEDQEGRDPNW